MNKLPILFFAFIFIVLAGSVRAESLDDDSIRGMYAQAVSEILSGDLNKVQQTMQTRLNPAFSLTVHGTIVMLPAQPQTTTGTLDKNQAIANAMQSFHVMKMSNYRNDVTDIKYSDDHKYAYVTAQGSASGNIDIPVDPQHTEPGHYAMQQACLDTLALATSLINYVKSECNSQLTVTR